MGLLNRLMGREDGGDDVIIDEDEDWDKDDWEEEDENWDEDGDEEEQKQEWETAYQFTKDGLEARGFQSPKEFMQKAMVYRINRSPLFRDRIKVGRETMAMVNDTMEMTEELSGEKTSYGEMAQELEEANKLISQVEDFGPDDEDQMVWEITRLAGEAIDVMKDRSGREGGVKAGTATSEQEL